MASVDDELILSGEDVTVACTRDDCENAGVDFTVPIELDAVCGPCGTLLYKPE